MFFILNVISYPEIKQQKPTEMEKINFVYTIFSIYF